MTHNVENLESIVEDDIQISNFIKGVVGVADSGKFHFRLQAGVSEYIISRFKINLDKVAFHYNQTLNRPNIELTMSVAAPVAEAVIEAPVVQEAETIEEIPEEEQPKRKVRK